MYSKDPQHMVGTETLLIGKDLKRDLTRINLDLGLEYMWQLWAIRRWNRLITEQLHWQTSWDFPNMFLVVRPGLSLSPRVCLCFQMANCASTNIFNKIWCSLDEDNSKQHSKHVCGTYSWDLFVFFFFQKVKMNNFYST